MYISMYYYYSLIDQKLTIFFSNASSPYNEYNTYFNNL